MQYSTDTVSPRPFPMSFDFHRGETRLERGSVAAERLFGADELVFAGHFPRNKILPGVMLVEYALYLAEVYLAAQADARELAEIKTATFLAPVFPGGRVGCRCEFSAGDGDMLDMKAVLTRAEVICAKVRASYGRRGG